MIKNYRLLSIIFSIILIFLSCSLIGINEFDEYIIKNRWTGETVFFSDVNSQILKQKYINRGWSKINKDKSVPYFKLKNHKGVVLGNYFINQKEYLIVQLKNGKKYKWEKNHLQIDDKALPNHLCRLKILNDAKGMIGKHIWLNNVAADTIFINNTGLVFNRFKKVKIIDTKVYTNGGRDWPVWLVIKSDNEFNVEVRYNGKNKTEGKQNYYFENDPLPKKWGKDILNKIMSGKIIYGMNESQVRVSIGNPNIINNTSSRHSVSEQWIYGNNIGNKKYLLFEYGKLVSM